MRRLVGKGYATSISTALDALPTWLSDELRAVPFFCGVDPVFAGLHDFTCSDDGRNYASTAHVVYPEHLTHRPRNERQATIVLPEVESPWVVIHELGHILHERLGFPPAPEPVTGYAATNVFEAFAEAFTMAHVPGYAPWDVSRARLATYKMRYPRLAPYFERRKSPCL